MSDEKSSVTFKPVNSAVADSVTDQSTGYALPFPAVLAYHVKDPLTSINLAIDLLESTAIDNTQQTYLSFIKRNYLRINNLMNLLLSQQSSGEMHLQECSVQKFIEDSVEMLNERIMLENISVSRDYNEEDFSVIINESKMRIALMNILVNAMDAMSLRNGSLKLSTKITAGKYSVEIKDNGCGIKKERLKYISLPSYSRKPNATGMGLALTYDILKANDVALDIQSAENEGTCFILSFNNNHNSRFATL